MKILHSADWHLDSPISGKTPAQTELLKSALMSVPQKVAQLASGCDAVLLSGDLFDGAYTQQSLRALQNAVEEMAVPVFLAAGNHDHLGSASPWQTAQFPGNLHIFAAGQMQSVSVPELSLRVYGASFSSQNAGAMLAGFHADCEEKYAVAVLHGDPVNALSPYCPISRMQVQSSGLDYLALGHIHAADQFWAGKTLCAWPGCPMGRGYDETGEKGVLIVTLDGSVQTEFIPIDTGIRFFDFSCAPDALDSLLPAVGNDNFYRVTLTGECDGFDAGDKYARFPNLTLRDHTVPPLDLWANAGQDTPEGVYFRMLREAMDGQDAKTQERIRLAAKLSKQLLLGQEVSLP